MPLFVLLIPAHVLFLKYSFNVIYIYIELLCMFRAVVAVLCTEPSFKLFFYLKVFCNPFIVVILQNLLKPLETYCH